jgi:hypothetical protein
MTRRFGQVWLLRSFTVFVLLLSTAVWAKKAAFFGIGVSKKEEKAAPASSGSAC